MSRREDGRLRSLRTCGAILVQKCFETFVERLCIKGQDAVLPLVLEDAKNLLHG